MMATGHRNNYQFRCKNALVICLLCVSCVNSYNPAGHTYSPESQSGRESRPIVSYKEATGPYLPISSNEWREMFTCNELGYKHEYRYVTHRPDYVPDYGSAPSTMTEKERRRYEDLRNHVEGTMSSNGTYRLEVRSHWCRASPEPHNVQPRVPIGSDGKYRPYVWSSMFDTYKTYTPRSPYASRNYVANDPYGLGRYAAQIGTRGLRATDADGSTRSQRGNGDDTIVIDHYTRGAEHMINQRNARDHYSGDQKSVVKLEDATDLYLPISQGEWSRWGPCRREGKRYRRRRNVHRHEYVPDYSDNRAILSEEERMGVDKDDAGILSAGDSRGVLKIEHQSVPCEYKSGINTAEEEKRMEDPLTIKQTPTVDVPNSTEESEKHDGKNGENTHLSLDVNGVKYPSGKNAESYQPVRREAWSEWSECNDNRRYRRRWIIHRKGYVPDYKGNHRLVKKVVRASFKAIDDSNKPRKEPNERLKKEWEVNQCDSVANSPSHKTFSDGTPTTTLESDKFRDASLDDDSLHNMPPKLTNPTQHVEPAKPEVTVEPKMDDVGTEPEESKDTLVQADPTQHVEPAKPEVTVEPKMDDVGTEPEKSKDTLVQADPTQHVEPAKPEVTVEPKMDDVGTEPEESKERAQSPSRVRGNGVKQKKLKKITKPRKWKRVVKPNKWKKITKPKKEITPAKPKKPIEPKMDDVGTEPKESKETLVQADPTQHVEPAKPEETIKPKMDVLTIEPKASKDTLVPVESIHHEKPIHPVCSTKPKNQQPSSIEESEKLDEAATSSYHLFLDKNGVNYPVGDGAEVFKPVRRDVWSEWSECNDGRRYRRRWIVHRKGYVPDYTNNHKLVYREVRDGFKDVDDSKKPIINSDEMLEKEWEAVYCESGKAVDSYGKHSHDLPPPMIGGPKYTDESSEENYDYNELDPQYGNENEGTENEPEVTVEPKMDDVAQDQKPVVKLEDATDLYLPIGQGEWSDWTPCMHGGQKYRCRLNFHRHGYVPDYSDNRAIVPEKEREERAKQYAHFLTGYYEKGVFKLEHQSLPCEYKPGINTAEEEKRMEDPLTIPEVTIDHNRNMGEEFEKNKKLKEEIGANRDSKADEISEENYDYNELDPQYGNENEATENEPEVTVEPKMDDVGTEPKESKDTIVQADPTQHVEPAKPEVTVEPKMDDVAQDQKPVVKLEDATDLYLPIRQSEWSRWGPCRREGKRYRRRGNVHRHEYVPDYSDNRAILSEEERMGVDKADAGILSAGDSRGVLKIEHQSVPCEYKPGINTAEEEKRMEDPLTIPEVTIEQPLSYTGVDDVNPTHGIQPPFTSGVDIRERPSITSVEHPQPNGTLSINENGSVLSEGIDSIDMKPTSPTPVKNTGTLRGAKHNEDIHKLGKGKDLGDKRTDRINFNRLPDSFDEQQHGPKYGPDTQHDSVVMRQKEKKGQETGKPKDRSGGEADKVNEFEKQMKRPDYPPNRASLFTRVLGDLLKGNDSSNNLPGEEQDSKTVSESDESIKTLGLRKQGVAPHKTVVPPTEEDTEDEEDFEDEDFSELITTVKNELGEDIVVESNDAEAYMNSGTAKVAGGVFGILAALAIGALGYRKHTMRNGELEEANEIGFDATEPCNYQEVETAVRFTDEDWDSAQ